MLSACSRLLIINNVGGRNRTAAVVLLGAMTRRHDMLASSEPVEGGYLSSRRLLLVDSDPDVHDLLHSVLQRDDRILIDAEDAAGAVASLRREPCDLVLAGPAKNGTDGVKLLRRIRSLQPAAK